METRKRGAKARRLALPILWMVLIFGFSGEALSSSHTSRVIIPFLRLLLPQASPEALSLLHEGVRKLSHFCEYFLLSYLWTWSLRPYWPKKEDARFLFLLAFSLSLGYAFLDELRQSLSPSRGPSLWDVLIDGSGALCLQAVLWLRLRRSGARAP